MSHFQSVDSSEDEEEDDDNGSEDGAAVNPPALASVAELASIEEVDDDEEAGASPDLWGDWPTVDGVYSLQDPVDDTGPDDLSSFQRSHAFVQSFPDSHLDPMTPEFVPSSQSRAVSSDSGSLYHQDGLRPLPSGPSSWLHSVDPHMHTSELEDRSSETTDPLLSGRALPLTSSENPLRGSMDNEGRQCSGPVTASPLVSNDPSTASGSSTDQTSPSDTSLATPPCVPTTSPCSPMFAQEPDPPFRTDGRGRVVWSSATSPRSREGRRGRLSAAPVGYVAQPTVVPVSQFESGHGVDDESDMGTAL